MANLDSNKGFTFIEILVSISLVALIAALVALVFNPSNYFVRARDLRRLKDLQILSTALSIYFFQYPNPDPDGPNLDSRGVDETYPTIFISVPYEIEQPFTNCFDPVSNKWLYVFQVSQNNLKKNNGTGWIPINFSEMLIPPINELPIDPINTFSSGYYYIYAFRRNPAGFEVDAALEYKRFRFGGENDKTSTDGGNDPRRLELGSDLTIIPPLNFPIQTQ